SSEKCVVESRFAGHEAICSISAFPSPSRASETSTISLRRVASRLRSSTRHLRSCRQFFCAWQPKKNLETQLVVLNGDAMSPRYLVHIQYSPPSPLSFPN